MATGSEPTWKIVSTRAAYGSFTLVKSAFVKADDFEVLKASIRAFSLYIIDAGDVGGSFPFDKGSAR